MKNFYAILNIGPISSLDEIKAAYRRLAKAHHPDKGGDPNRFHDIQEAYETLCNPVSRHEYDLRRSRQPFEGETYRVARPNFRPETMDIFDDIIDVVGRRLGAERVSKFEAEIVLSPREAAEGTNLRVEIPVERICEACFGFGGTLFADCRHCGGVGVIAGMKRLDISIPPGAQADDSISIRSGDIEIRGRIIIER